MSLDKTALESLRLPKGTDSKRYEDAPRRNRRRWIIAAIVLALLALLAWRLVGGPLAVRTATVQGPAGASEGAVLNASGYVVARRLATVSSKVTGRLVEVLFEEGARVEQDQVLARLDPSMAQAEYEVAEKSLLAARRGLREIEVRLAEARRTLERNRSLVERKLVAQSVLDASEAEADALAARLASARAEVAVAESNLALRRQSLDDLVIHAPFAGVVISKDAQPGETVSPISAGGGFTRTGIATIVDMASREIEVDVNEAYINRVRDGQQVNAVLDAYPEWSIPAYVISIVPTADRQKATVRVRIAFDELDPRILPDMGIKVSFLEDEAGVTPGAASTIPANAVQVANGSSWVWVVRDGKVERRTVRTGEAEGDRVPVPEGLEAGEVVVIDPPRRLRDGAVVELQGE
jgi:RND family efflux transporter MFP subunit